MLGSGRPLSCSSALHNNAILIIPNDEMKDIIRIIKSLEDLLCYQKELVKQFKIKLKNKEEDFLVCYKVN